MAERRGGFLRGSAKDNLKRSSSVEILTSTDGQLLSRRSTTSTSHLAGPVSTNPAPKIQEQSPPDRQTSASSGSIGLISKSDAPMQNGTVSARNQRSLENVRLGEKPPKKKGAGLPALKMPFKAAPAPSTAHPQLPPSGTPVGTPIIGKEGHIFTISTAVPDQPPARESGHDLASVVKRRPSGPPTVTHTPEGEGEPIWQRRLSQLFVPPREDEFEHEKDAQETSFLLPKSSPRLKSRRTSTPERDLAPKSSSSAVGPPEKERERYEAPRAPGKIDFKDEGKGKRKKKRAEEEDTDRLEVLDKLESGRHDDSEFDSSSSSSASSSDDEEQNGDDYMSWDDTICSNRSAYFKMYYTQRGVIGGQSDTKSKASRASSQNSLSSLIREKMGKPDSRKTKTRGDLGLMVLVALLFTVIVVGITLTTYFYNLHLLELSIFKQIKFFETPRILEIYNPEWKPIIKAHLGSFLPNNSIPEDCTHYLQYLKKHNYSIGPYEDDEEYEDMICLDWPSLARLQLRKLQAVDDVQCYSVWWVSAQEDFTLRDCVQVGGEQGSWWGGGEMSKGGFPVNKASVPPGPMVTGKLGRDSWGHVLRRAWYSEKASLLSLPENFRGRVSVNNENDGQICLESALKPSLKNKVPVLKYTLCTAQNVTTVMRHLHNEALAHSKTTVPSEPLMAPLTSNLKFDSEKINATTPPPPASQSSRDLQTEEAKAPVSSKPNVNSEKMNVTTPSPPPIKSPRDLQMEEAKARVEARLENPVWIPWMSPDQIQLTQDAILNYVYNVANMSGEYKGHILLPPSWQRHPGDLTFDSDRFPDPLDLVKKIEDKGFRLALSIHPFVSVNAPSFNKGTQEGLWIRQRKSDLPALTNYDDTHPSAVADFSNPRAKTWFSVELEKLKTQYNIDRFHLKPVDSHAFPACYEYHMPIAGPDGLIAHFLESVSAVSPPVSTEGAVMPPGAPTFLTLGNADGSWEGLETLVPRVLTLAMLGFPFVDIGTIGGIARAGHIPSRELYIRWMEIATFLPAMQISVLPDRYGQEMTDLAAKYMKIRKTVVLPRLREKIQGALEDGTPLITPLALFSPNDPEAVQISDEWILGDDLLVAPIVQRGKRVRDIYLPAGIWKDEIDGSFYRGGKVIKNYKVALTKIAYFSLKPMNNDPA